MLRTKGTDKKKSKRVRESDLSSDSESEVDPKHGRRGKRKAYIMGEADEAEGDIGCLQDFLDGVTSCSNVPSGVVGSDLATEIPSMDLVDDHLVQTTVQLKPHRQLRLVIGRGKQLAALSFEDDSEDDEGESSHVALSQDSIVGPHPSKSIVKPVIQQVILPTLDDQRVILSHVAGPKPSSVFYFRPSSAYQSIFEDAIQNVRSIFFSQLKNAKFSEVGKVASNAEDIYATMKQPKGDPVPLRARVGHYVSAVKSYLMVDNLPVGRRREDGIILAHQKCDRARLLLDEA